MTKFRRGTMSLMLALSAAAAFGAGVARAQDAGADEPTTIWNFDQKLRDKMLETLGLKDGPSIDYRERSPLVVPPTRDLPPPQQKSVKAQVPANWPADPDAAKARASASKPAAKTTTSDQNWMGFLDNIQSPGKAGGSVSPGKVTDPDASEAPLKPSDLNYKGNMFSNVFKRDDDTEYGTFTGEQPRTSLIEPPAGYQTPSPNQPYGVTKRTTYGKATKGDQAGGDALPK